MKEILNLLRGLRTNDYDKEELSIPLEAHNYEKNRLVFI